jgi:hypothetical protein
MATLNGNDIYLRVNAVDVESRWRGFEMKLSIDKEDTSAGTGTTHKKSAAKLQEVTAKLTLVYDSTAAPTDAAAIYGLSANHVIPVVYGPENNTAGKPKDDRDYLVTGINGPSTSVDKKLVMWEVDLVSTGDPRSNIYEGDVFP